MTVDWLFYSLSITFYKYPDITLSFVRWTNHWALYKASIDSFICLVAMRPPTPAAAACPLGSNCFHPFTSIIIHSIYAKFILLFYPMLVSCQFPLTNVTLVWCIQRSSENIFPLSVEEERKVNHLSPQTIVNTWFTIIPIRAKQSADEEYWAAQSNSHVVWTKCRLFSFNYTM